MPDMKKLRERLDVSLAVPWRYDTKLSHFLLIIQSSLCQNSCVISVVSPYWHQVYLSMHTGYSVPHNRVCFRLKARKPISTYGGKLWQYWTNNRRHWIIRLGGELKLLTTNKSRKLRSIILAFAGSCGPGNEISRSEKQEFLQQQSITQLLSICSTRQWIPWQLRDVPLVCWRSTSRHCFSALPQQPSGWRVSLRNHWTYADRMFRRVS
jgi:hypothetical protein